MNKAGRSRLWLKLHNILSLGIAALPFLTGSLLRAQTGSLVNGAYLMAFHACNTATTNCTDPRNHMVYLAQSSDGAAWSIIPRWSPFPGSVPDVIRRGNLLYIYTASDEVVRYHLDMGTLDAPARVSVSGLPAGFVDPSLTIDEQGRLVLFFLYGRPGSDPAGCPPGQPTCQNRFGSATEVTGSDGAQFTLDPGDRVTVALSPSGVRSASDPDIFFDGRQHILYLSHGPSISVWTSSDLRGTYAKLGDLSNGTGGIPAGHFDPGTMKYWTYSHVNKNGVAVIRRAMHSDLSRALGESDWTNVITGAGMGLTVATNVESPGFAVNISGTTAAIVADLSITKSASADPTAVGGNLAYTIVAANNGPSTASGVTVTDALPSNVSFVSATAAPGNCTQTGVTVVCSIGNLASGAGARVAIIVTPRAAGSISNRAAVRGNETDPNSANDSATAASTASYILHFAQFGNGAGITSDAVFTSSSATATTTGKLEFFDDSGLALALGISGLGTRSSVDFSVPPLGALTISTDGLAGLLVGSARVTSDVILGGVVRFSIPGIGIAGVGDSQPLSGFIVPVRRKSGGINTGIAIRNTENVAAAVTLTLRDRQGTTLADTTGMIAPGGHLALLVNELFPRISTDDLMGTLMVQAGGGKIAAIALELGPVAGQFTTLPVTPLQ